MAKVENTSSGRAWPAPRPNASEGNIYTIPGCFHHISYPLSMKSPQKMHKVEMDNPTFHNSELGLIIPPYTEKHSLKKPANSSALTCHKLENYPCLKFWKLHFKTKEATLHHRTIVLFLVLLVVLLVLVLGIAIVVYIAAGGNVTWNDTSNDSKEEGSWAVEGEFRVTNRAYTSDMNDHTSLTFLRMATEVTKSLEELFFMSFLVRDYNATEIIGFRKGSVIVECRIFLNRPFTRAAEQVGLTFVQILEKGHGLLPKGSLHVDITSIKFAGLHGVLMPPVGLEPITPSPSDAAWSPWGQWSSCNDLQGRCDPNRIHSRSRDCRTELGHGIRLLNNDQCRRKGGHEIEITDCVCFVTEPSSSIPNLTSIKSFPLNEARVIQNVTTQEAVSANEVVGESTSEPIDEPCSHCQQGICLISDGVLAPRCVHPIDAQDPRGCGGWCAGSHEICRQLEDHLYQCVDVSECHSEEWRCGDGLCIPGKRRCDGHFNCYDMTDEGNCDCKENEFHCGNDTSCLPVSRRCNGYIDCWDGSDEANCTTMCPSSQFTCNDGQCIPKDYFCDSYYDCEDTSDEPEMCRAPCLTHQQQCQNGRCVNHEAWCDGVDTCGDNSDEQNCSLSTIIA